MKKKTKKIFNYWENYKQKCIISAYNYGFREKEILRIFNISKLEYNKINKKLKDEKLKEGCRSKVQNAIKNKKLIPTSCEECGKKKTDAHHTDYSKPLQINWLCRLHHKQIHKIKKL